MQNPKYINASGTETRYFEAGKGEPLVLVHGGTFGAFSSAEDWEQAFDKLAEHFHVFAIDRLGQGHTDNPKSDADYLIGATVEHLHNFIKAAGIGKAHLAGHSNGGYNVCRLALEHPEDALSVIIVDSATMVRNVPHWYEDMEQKALKLPTAREQNRYRMAANSFSGSHVTDFWLDASVKIEQLPKFQQAAAKMEKLRARFQQDRTERQKETHAWIRAGRLTAPTLMVWAYNDPSAKFDPFCLELMSIIFPNVPKAQLHVLNQAGHYCYREQPDGFVAVVKGFVDSLKKA